MPREKKREVTVAVKPAAGRVRSGQTTVPKKRGRPVGSKNSTTKKQLTASSRQKEAPVSDTGARAVSRSAHPGISITVQIPQLRRPKTLATAKKQPAVRKRRLLSALALPLVVLLATGGMYGYRMVHIKQITKPVPSATAAVRTAPDYDPLVPSAVQTSTKGYDGQKNIVSYTTTFSEARVTVSQQPLPPNFTTDPNALARAADSISAKQKIDTADGPIYIATSDTDKSQMGLFASKTVLVFIHTDKTLDDVSWKSFVELLKQKNWQDFNKTNG